MTDRRGGARPELVLNKASAILELTPAARQLHLAVLSWFVQTGRAPDRTRLAELVVCGAATLERLLRELDTHDVLALDERGQIRAAYPFSPEPTKIRVTWAGGPVTYAMCAVDALGMSAMLGRPVVIRATEPGTGTTIVVEVDDEEANWHPSTSVVYAAGIEDRCCPSVDRTCLFINFFTTADGASVWAGNHPEVTGVVLDQAEALAQATQEFGDLMRGIR